jgi:3-methylcrotonyl-CoA carboxylase alpha subunit
MFTKILIANRGEIACRVAATARRMGVRTVAVYSDADANAAHVQACDEAVHIGGNAPQDSYLQWQRILQAAMQTGAQAIHPGYGFLSENADFANACQQAGVVFIGPSSASIQAMGLKAASKQLMEKAGVPLVPGYHGVDQNPSLLAQEAQTMGFPVLIKASAGGGGKGMRIVQGAEDFADALASCQREAKNSFNDDAVLVEKYVQRPRHIEIQVFGDSHGNIIHLHERDCSVQRRHQKVLEESPAPGLTEAMRQRMGAAAVAAAKAVNYVGAGTVEFIVEQSERGMDFFFMEMNTRLQVEHPVTEAVTGLDLVEWQLRIAAGEALPLTQAQVKVQGHAIEARICAETPDNDFLPATGRLQVMRIPAAQSFTTGTVRWDSGVREGDEISPYYDSMIAKLIVHGDTREQALARLDQALSELHIVGVANNVGFLRQVVHSPSFAQAQLDTALIEREKHLLFHQQALPLALVVAAAMAHGLAKEAPRGNAWVDPWSQTDGWLMQGQSLRKFDYVCGEETGVALLTRHSHGPALLQIGEINQALVWQAQALRCNCNGAISDCMHMFTQRKTSGMCLPIGAVAACISSTPWHTLRKVRRPAAICLRPCPASC